jgi:Tfp pilus assembly protein PilO
MNHTKEQAAVWANCGQQVVAALAEDWLEKDAEVERRKVELRNLWTDRIEQHHNLNTLRNAVAAVLGVWESLTRWEVQPDDDELPDALEQLRIAAHLQTQTPEVT